MCRVPGIDSGGHLLGPYRLHYRSGAETRLGTIALGFCEKFTFGAAVRFERVWPLRRGNASSIALARMTSARMKSTDPAVARSNSVVSLPVSAFTSETITVAPYRAKASEAARPMPERHW